MVDPRASCLRSFWRDLVPRWDVRIRTLGLRGVLHDDAVVRDQDLQLVSGRFGLAPA